MRRNLALAVVLAISVSLIVLSALWRSESQAQLERVVVANCAAIEDLKAAQRQEAIEAYRDLDRTLRLLGIERTTEIEAVARENRDEKLVRFAPRECA